jgi:hypothetical protein
MRKLRVLVFILLSQDAYADRFVDKSAIPYGIIDIGGCKIISIRKEEEPSNKLLEWCKSRKVPTDINKNSWHDYYSSLELTLGDSLLLAERALGGARYSILDRNTQIVLYNEPYANASVSQSKDEIVISINSGLVELVELTIGGMTMELAASRKDIFSSTRGVTFSDWLENLRTPRYGFKKAYTAGPDADRPKHFGPAWFWLTRIDASVLYQFIFGHELAHVQAKDKGNVSSLDLESKRDLESFRSFSDKIFKGQSYYDRAALLVPSFSLAMWYTELYWSEEIKLSGRPVYEGSVPIFHVRNWKERGVRVLEDWLNSNRGIDKKNKRLIYAALKKTYALRAPLKIENIDLELLSNIKVVDRKITFDKDPSKRAVSYKYQIKNNNDVAVNISLEVQSRFFPRKENDEIVFSKRAPYDWDRKKPYKIHQDKSHQITLTSGSKISVSGILEWQGNEEVYPGINPRFLSITTTY